MVKKQKERMLERNYKDFEWSIVAGMIILFLLIALPASGQSCMWQTAQDTLQTSSCHCLEGNNVLQSGNNREGVIPSFFKRCLKRRDILRNSNGQIRWFSSAELMDRVIKKQPIERPSVLGKNNLRGIVAIQVVIDKNGRVICTNGVEGHPLGIASAIRSLREWTFKPYISKGKRKSIVGTLFIPYNFSDGTGKE